MQNKYSFKLTNFSLQAFGDVIFQLIEVTASYENMQCNLIAAVLKELQIKVEKKKVELPLKCTISLSQAQAIAYYAALCQVNLSNCGDGYMALLASSHHMELGKSIK